MRHARNLLARAAQFALPILLLGQTAAQAEDYSPPARDEHPTRVFWGDTHLHTNQSPDAFTFGNHGITPEEAYRFARGETVTSQTGQPARLARPLDFLMVSDHAEFMGVFPKVFSRSPDIVDSPLGKRWIGHVEAGHPERILMDFGMLSSGMVTEDNHDALIAQSPVITREYLQGLSSVEVPEEVRTSVWHQVIEAAEAFNEPGLFTAFIGYEWSSMPGGNNLHRNVLFRDGAEKTLQILPFSAMDGSDPEQLWDYLAAYERRTGGSVLAIPHNGNVSNGLMFAETTLDGTAMTRDYAERRARWEPIVEVTQIKGDGETHPFLSPNDEFADFENWDKANLGLTAVKEDWMLEYEYARSALLNGLAMADTLGANPYAFGMIGSTDSHTSLATADEDNFFGKMTSAEPAADRGSRSYFPVDDPNALVQLHHWESMASGYAAIWARENTREALFDAMRRKETYATTGPRMTVRFFGGWSFGSDDAQRSDLASHGYRHGVPMGGHLPENRDGGAPTFLVAAMKDPLGANLDRVQIIKGWVDADGEPRERVYNVAVSDGRAIQDNRVEPVGNTVDVESASYRNSIGEAELAVTWQDPDFDPAQRAFYYVRVLEIPTPRWTTIDAAHYDSALAPEPPPAIQERAYTSPIWYEPR